MIGAQRTRIKFCGLTRATDVQAARDLGVDYLGFVFAAGSPRCLTPDQAAGLRPPVGSGAGVVALCMDQDEDQVRSIVAAVQPDVLQFHGAEPPAFCERFGLPYWKVVAMGEAMADARCALEFARHSRASAFVLDGHRVGEPGGSGRGFDWSRMPRSRERPLLLAGGLDPDNVFDAVCMARPFAVDVSSGIEAAPGCKDAERMRRFVAQVRAADAVASKQQEGLDP